MLNQTVAEALNCQINNELYSAYLYLALSSYSQQIGLKGVANWFKIQSQEEMTHALKFYNYLISQGAPAVMRAIDEPPALFDDVAGVFEKTLEHEQFITKCIADLVDLARQEKDHATEIMLQWFVTEQVEEEASATEIIEQLKMVGDKASAIFMVDHQLGKRKAD